MARALLALGANLGDPAAQITAAIEALLAPGDVHLLARSSLHETVPIGGPADQPNYLNSAILVRTDLAPLELWQRMADVEQGLGRERHERWGARTLDLDLLLYDDVTMEGAVLTIPHPRLALRRFALEPAAEIAPEMRHPKLGRTLGELATHVARTALLAILFGMNAEVAQVLRARLLQRGGGWRIEIAKSFPPVDLPRLLVVPSGTPTIPLMFPGPIAFVDAAHLDRATELAAVALEGLA